MSTLDKFARLKALKPASRILPRDTSLRPIDDTDLVGRLLGAGVARNDFGEHLAIRNWYSTPEFCEPSEVALDLLSRLGGPAGSKAVRASGQLFANRQRTALPFERALHSKIPRSGYSSTPKPPDLPVAQARTHF